MFESIEHLDHRFDAKDAIPTLLVRFILKDNRKNDMVNTHGFRASDSVKVRREAFGLVSVGKNKPDEPAIVDELSMRATGRRRFHRSVYKPCAWSYQKAPPG